MTYTIKLKSAFGNPKCALKNIKSALFLFSAPCPEPEGNSVISADRINQGKWRQAKVL